MTEKIAVVTGGVRGIGKDVSLMLKDKGYKVIATYSKDEESAEKMRALGVETVKADVRNEEEISALFSSLKRVDVLCNNAGVSLIKQIQDTTLDEWNDVFAVNVTGAFLCTREASKKMISQKSGVIINISSVWGEVGGSCESVYSASKSALLGFTKALAKELGYSGIRVNSVSPGVIDTKMNSHFSKDEMQALQDEIPVGRIGTGKDVASAVEFLIDNEYVTGIDLAVNGGFSVY